MVVADPTVRMTVPSATRPQRLGRKTMFFLVCYAALRAGPLRGRRRALVQRAQAALGLAPEVARGILDHARESAAARSQVPRPFSPSRLMAHACGLARRVGGLDARQELLLVRLGEVLGVAEEQVREALERSGSVEISAPPPPRVGRARRWILAPLLACLVASLVGVGLVQRRLAQEYARGEALVQETTQVCLESLRDAEQGRHAAGLARVDAELARLEADPQRHRLDFLFAQLHYCRGRILHSEMFHRGGQVDHDVGIQEAYDEALRLIVPLKEQAPETFEVIVSGVAEYQRDVGEVDEAARLRAWLRGGPDFLPQSP